MEKSPPVSWGPSSYLTLVMSVLGAVSAIIAGIRGADAQMIGGGVVALGSAMTFAGSRTAQAVALTRQLVGRNRGTIDAVLDAIAETDEEADEVPDSELPTDAEEFDAPPPTSANTPVQASQDDDADPASVVIPPAPSDLPR